MDVFESALVRHGVLPVKIIVGVSWSVVAIEVVLCGLFAIATLYRSDWGFAIEIANVAMLSAFGFYLTAVMMLSGSEVACGCLGSLQSTVLTALVRVGVLWVVAVMCFLSTLTPSHRSSVLVP